MTNCAYCTHTCTDVLHYAGFSNYGAMIGVMGVVGERGGGDGPN